jgi:hypothetical protein
MAPRPPRRRLEALAMTALLALPAAAAASAGATGAHAPAAGQGAAAARARFVPQGPDAGLYCGKDYGQNSATGDYCVRLKATSSPPPVVVKHDGFSWGDAGAGAVAALALGVATAGGTAVLRRRRATPSAGTALRV